MTWIALSDLEDAIVGLAQELEENPGTPGFNDGYLGALRDLREEIHVIVAEKVKARKQMLERELAALNAQKSPAELEKGVIDILLSGVDGAKIKAIKFYRDATGVGLAEAKQAVEAIQSLNNL